MPTPSSTPDAPVRLTTFSHGAGCGCKLAPDLLDRILGGPHAHATDPRLLVGPATKDDAAVYAMDGDTVLISTVDFFTPIVDDARTFGRIAAANALSDVYAMGGSPLFAIAVLGWPAGKLPPELAAQVVEGGRDMCREAGIALAGGHSIDAPEPFFGLAVTGNARKAHIKRNDGAQPGDVLLLTKPVGTGVLSTALKRGVLDEARTAALSAQLCTLNRAGAALGPVAGVHAMTDVTGFGLLGHLWEMCEGSGCSAVIDWTCVPRMDGAAELVAQTVYTDGGMRNWRAVQAHVTGADSMERMILAADPQTNGGLLIAVSPDTLEEVRQILERSRTNAAQVGVFGQGPPSILIR
ncbi:MAG: selenide, water dikinase SelD [Flavobacteriales bacterium]|nr:Selenide, water dikinase [Flavobacteriales bacterium]MCC6576898.1 selenide, water dikinase SelD [Flavobacteriales bacterium]NUQ14064.1 selenide, water dikinase SelD [Flavobacteriales bacterium]